MRNRLMVFVLFIGILSCRPPKQLKFVGVFVVRLFLSLLENRNLEFEQKRDWHN